MGWDFIPDIESFATSSSDNLWAEGCPKPVGKVSVAFPAEEWCCRKFEDLNRTTLSGCHRVVLRLIWQMTQVGFIYFCLFTTSSILFIFNEQSIKVY